MIPEISAIVRATPGCLSLAQGMVSWGPPQAVSAAVTQALRDPTLALDRYGPMAGDPPLLEAIARELTRADRAGGDHRSG